MKLAANLSLLYPGLPPITHWWQRHSLCRSDMLSVPYFTGLLYGIFLAARIIRIRRWHSSA